VGDIVRFVGEDDLYDLATGSIGVIVEIEQEIMDMRGVCYVRFESQREAFPNRFPGRLFLDFKYRAVRPIYLENENAGEYLPSDDDYAPDLPPDMLYND
jgi:hypothetical protein